MKIDRLENGSLRIEHGAVTLTCGKDEAAGGYVCTVATDGPYCGRGADEITALMKCLEYNLPTFGSVFHSTAHILKHLPKAVAEERPQSAAI